MKRVKKSIVLIMIAAMILSGCGKEEKVVDNGTDAPTNYESAEQMPVQNEAETQGNIQETAIISYEELEEYQSDRMAGIVAAFEDSGLSYELTENQKIAYNSDTRYLLLENEYKMYCIGYSMYDSGTGTADTVMSIKYEFHPEKGLSGDNEIVKLLYSFIQTADNVELKDTYKSGEELATGLMDTISSGVTSTVFDAANTKLVIEAENASKFILKYAEIDRILCNIEQPEQSYKEFDSYADYKAYIEHEGLGENLEKYIAGKDNKVIDISENPGAVSAETDPETLTAQSGGIQTYMSDWMTVGIFTYRNQDNRENNFEIKVAFNMEFNDAHKDMFREYLHMELEYLQSENLLPSNCNMDDWEKEMISHVQLDKLVGYYGTDLDDWFGVNMRKYSKYPQLEEGKTILVPTKVEGLLNG